VATLLTQVLVDADDPGFANPSKPVGPWFEAAQADALAAAGMALLRDAAGRGRRVVASPQPLRVIEASVIERMLDLGVVVIAAGGGGIPVVERQGRLQGVEAVVDKDLATALLAVAVGAERLVLVTGVPGVYRDFATDRARLLERVTAEELHALAAAGHFPAGSMGPKVAAALQFVRAGGRAAVICQPADLAAAIEGRAGTVVEAKAGV
jgi:carbamate kinase